VWGYLAAGLEVFGFLQPGRHTFALYTVLAVASGGGIVEVADRLRSGPGRRLDLWVIAGVTLIGCRIFVPMLQTQSYRFRADLPFLGSEPSKRMLWVLDRVKRHVKPGERLLYEEGGFRKHFTDPYQ